MAQTGYTPILIYSSSTTSNVPAAGSLTNSTLGSELAINITDGKLFYKDNAGAVQVIGWKTVPTTAGGTGLTSYTAGDLLYYASGTALTKLAIGATGRWLGSSGTAPQWNAPAALTKTDDTNVTLTLGGSASTALLNAASITVGWTGTLATSRGGTGLSSFTANGVVYASSTSALSTSSNFQFDGTNVGIGIAPGTYLLNVAGSVNSTTSLNVNNTGTTSNILFASSGQTGTTARSNTVARIQSTASGRDVNIQLSDNVANSAEVGMVGGTLYFATGGSVKVDLDTGGNIIPKVAAKGINFTANTPAAGMTSQLLNWYEEGTWTPTVTAGSGTITSVTGASGKYVRIGKTVYVNCTFQITTNGTGASYLIVSGLPFTVSTASPSAGYNASDAISLSGAFGASSTQFNLFKYDGTYPGASGKTYYSSGVYLV